jgi:hypothetical protein
VLLQHTISKWNAVFSLHHNIYINTAAPPHQSIYSQKLQKSRKGLIILKSFPCILYIYLAIILHFVSTYFMLISQFNSYHSLLSYDNMPHVVISLICDNSVTTQNLWFFQENLLKVLKCYTFLWVQRWHNCTPAASFANCVMTLYLLKVHLQTFLFPHNKTN